MNLPRLNGSPVLRGDVDMPPEGAWTADVYADLQEVPRAGVLELLGQTYRGTVLQGDLVGGTARLRLVGGAGCLLRQLAPKSYVNGVTAGALLQDLAQEAGETLSPTIAADVRGRSLTRWTRPAGTARDLIAHLAAYLGLTWRVLLDGTLWMGRYLWQEAPAAAEGSVLIDAAPQDARRTVAAESAPWEPGQTLQGWRIGAVRHFVEKESSRTTLVAYQPGLADLVQGELVRAGSAYSAPLPGRAVVQDADGTLQVLPDDPRWPPIVKVPIRPGIPCTIQVDGGARVLLLNTLGLMPGTVAVDMDDAGLRLHVLDERLPVVAETRALEAAITRLFGGET